MQKLKTNVLIIDINREHCLPSVNWPVSIILFIVLFTNDLDANKLVLIVVDACQNLLM